MTDIIVVHGMFQAPKSWRKWVAVFSEKGFNCVAPAWPLHDGDPKALRDDPPAGLGELHLTDVLQSIEQEVRALGRPIMIGHSVGGLVTQIMLSKGRLSAAIAIDSVPPTT